MERNLKLLSNLPPEPIGKVAVRERALATAIRSAYEFGLERKKTKREAFDHIAGMLRSAGDRPGNPWSAAFVSHCLKGAGFNLTRILYPSSALSWISWARRSGRVSLDHPTPGDLFFIDRPGVTRIGFVLQLENGIVTTIEGDLDRVGIPDGPYVLANTLRTSEVTGFVSLAPRSRATPIALLAA